MFKHIKTRYENIYTWSSKDEGTCFYCKEDKDVALVLIKDKGICQDCLDRFEIGRLGVDRHVIHKIMPEFKNAREAINWFKKMTPYRYEKQGESGDREVYLYDCIYDEAVYRKYKAMLEDGTSPLPLTEDMLASYDRIEFRKDGSVHIIY